MNSYGLSSTAILWMVGKEALTLLSLGGAAGLAAGMLAARLVSSQLFGLSSADPVSVTFAVTAMLLVTCLAAFLPARRAAQVDPMVAFALRIVLAVHRRNSALSVLPSNRNPSLGVGSSNRRPQVTISAIERLQRRVRRQFARSPYLGTC